MDHAKKLLKLFLILAMAAPAMLLAQKKTTLIVTSDTEFLYPIKTTEEDLREAPERFERELRRLREEHSDALLVDMGNSISISVGMETHYQAGIPQLAMEMDFAAVNLTPRDVLLSSMSTYHHWGLEEEAHEKAISNLDVTYPAPVEFDVARTVDDTTFVAANHPRAASGLGAKLAFLEETDPQAARQAVREARKEGRLVVGITTMPSRLRASYFGEKESTPHLLLALHADEKEIRQDEGSWVVPAPGRGRIMILEVEEDEAGELRKPKTSHVEYMREEDIARLPEYPKLRRAMPFGNVQSVIESFFPHEGTSVRVERIPLERVEEFTSARQPTVHHVQSEGKQLRLYRVLGQMTDFQGKLQGDPGWPAIDSLVVLNDDHSFNRIISRINFPVLAEHTTVLEAVNKLRGKDPEQWEPDPELTRGVEELWHWAVHEVKVIMEMDRELFGQKAEELD